MFYSNKKWRMSEVVLAHVYVELELDKELKENAAVRQAQLKTLSNRNLYVIVLKAVQGN